MFLRPESLLGLACTECQASCAFRPTVFCDYENLWCGRDTWEAAPQEHLSLGEGSNWGVTASACLQCNNEALVAQAVSLLSGVPALHDEISHFFSRHLTFRKCLCVLYDEHHLFVHGACLLKLCWICGTSKTFEGFSWDDPAFVEPMCSLISV